MATSESGCEQRHGGDDVELDGRGKHVPVDRAQAAPAEQREHGQQRADDDEGSPRPDRCDHSRRRDRPKRHRAHHRAPDQPERAAEQLVRDDPLEEREAGDVLDAVRGAHDREQQDRRLEGGARRDQRDRQSPEDERHAERDGQTASPERHRSERARQAAEPETGGQVADRPVAGVEDAEDDHDDQDVQTTAHEALRRHQEEDQPCRPADGANAVEYVLARAPARGARLNHALDMQRREQQGAGEQRACRRREDDSRVRDRHEHAREERPGQRAEALDRRARAVGSDQLFRRPGERWEHAPASRGGRASR